MNVFLDLKTVCRQSEDIVAREIEGEILIVPLVAGIGDSEDELYTLNDTGQAIWQKLDGERTLGEVAQLLSLQFDIPLAQLEQDVLGFASELARRRILVARP
ncbi:MAG: PqqD family protein [Syntrophobacteraceae bacterium]